MHLQAPSSAQCLVRLGEQSFRIARPSLGWIDALPPVLSLPWAPATVRGLVATGRGLLPLLQAPSASTPAPHPSVPAADGLADPWLVVLHTPLGLVGVAARAIDEAPSPEALGDAPHLLAALADWSADLQAPPAVPHVALAPAAAITRRRTAYLRVRSGSHEVVVPATEVGQVVRHDGLQPWRPGDAGLSVVQIGATMGLAYSLAASDPASAASVAEPWCLCAPAPNQPGLLVETVLGFIEADDEQLHTLHHAGHHARWLQAPGAPALPVRHLQDAIARSAAAPLSPGVPSFAPSVSAPAGLRLTAGPWHLVLPARRVHSVLGYANALTLSARRRPGALPVFDLGRCWGIAANAPRAAAASRLAVQVRWGRRAAVLLCDQASPAHLAGGSAAPAASTADGAWPDPSALPALPVALSGLVQAVRLQADGLAFLLRDHPAPGLRRPGVRAHLIAAGVGWYTAPETSFSS